MLRARLLSIYRRGRESGAGKSYLGKLVHFTIVRQAPHFRQPRRLTIGRRRCILEPKGPEVWGRNLAFLDDILQWCKPRFHALI